MRKYLLIVAALTALAILVDAFFIEPYRIEVTHNSLNAAVSAPIKIALLADIHTRGFGLREKKLVRLLDAENPDVIVIAGDTVGRDSDYSDVTTFLQQLRAPLGVWLVRGNLENHSLRRNEHAMYASVGVHFLLNEAKPIRPDIWLLGLDDPSSGMPRPDPALQTVPDGAYTIALFHAPAYFDRIAGRVPLVLVGHTHGGQIRIPFVPVLWLPPGSGVYLEGWYAERGSHMYVTRGIGTSTIWARFLCRPELSIVMLQPPASDNGGGGSGGNGTPIVSVGLPQVAPLGIVLQPGASQQFSVTVPCTNVPRSGVCPQGVTWKASIGAIDGAGSFTAPSMPGSGAVTATSSADTSKSGTAAITVVSEIPVTQSCRARTANVTSLSCSLPFLAVGHTLVAVVRVHGSNHVSVGAFSDTMNGTWPSVNSSSAAFNSAIGALAGGAAFFSSTTASSSRVSITVQFSGGTAGDELAVWDFPGKYSLDGAFLTPTTGTSGVTPVLATAKAGDLVLAWSVLSLCFEDTSHHPPFTDISLPGSCNVDVAAEVPSVPQANISNLFVTDGNNSVSGIMALSPIPVAPPSSIR
jgi:predicted MPP superfamily phosphohydrolase